VKVLGICGSLRAASLNSSLLRTAARIAPAGMHVSILAGLGELPLFNPDLEASPPHAVMALRRAVDAADALLIAAPEYARGVSGTIKNALDWLVSHEAFVGKRVALLNASPRAHHAQAALRETLRTMTAVLIEEASVAIPLLGSGLTEEAMAHAPAITGPLRHALEALAAVHTAVAAPGPCFLLP
jgi:chromate reductase, NAD(P)H dehydrogenase (quinone)